MASVPRTMLREYRAACVHGPLSRPLLVLLQRVQVAFLLLAACAATGSAGSQAGHAGERSRVLEHNVSPASIVHAALLHTCFVG
jgi:hypothetical protein